MSLPLNTSPVYTLEIPSTKKPFKYRSFLVKDEKALLVAQQTESTSVMLDTVKDIIKSCSKSELDVDNLALFDIEYIFLKLRSVSIGEIVNLVFTCIDHEKPVKIKVPVNLDNAKVESNPDHTSRFELFDDVGIQLKYPTIDTIKKIESLDNLNDFDSMIEIIIECIDFIYDSNEVYKAKDTSKKELVEFIENLSSDQYEKLKNFFETMPKLSLDINYECPECKKEYKRRLEGIESFF
jgi:hypothetical protein